MLNNDERNKFIWDTVRAIIFAVGAYIATVTIIQPFEKIEKQKMLLSNESLQIQARVIDNFLSTSSLYASSIYRVMSNTSGLSEAKKIEMYEIFYINYRDEKTKISTYFKMEESKKSEALLKKSNYLAFQLWQMYLNKIDRSNWEKLRRDFKKSNQKIAQFALETVGLLGHKRSD